MSKVASGTDLVPDAFFEFLGVWKSPIVFAGPDAGFAKANLEDSGRAAGHQGHAAKFLFKRRQEFLRHPGGTQQPPAGGAIFDFDRRLIHGVDYEL